MLELTKDGVLSLFKPVRDITVDAWADQFRYMGKSVTGRPGKWRTQDMPYEREPMRSFTNPDNPCTVLCWGTQLGKTECFLNFIGYLVDRSPCNILLKYPSELKAKDVSRQKIRALIEDNILLREKFVKSKRGTGDGGNTTLKKNFTGGTLYMAGANSTAGLRGASCPVVIQDEVDDDEPNKDGDPVKLADSRTESFTNACKIKASTPTRKGFSRIWTLLEASNFQMWHCPCPKCGFFQVLKWSSVKWTWTIDGQKVSDPSKACYVCENCNAELTDLERIRMILWGEWRKTRPGNKLHGYWLSGLNRIAGDKKGYTSLMHKWVEDFLDMQKKNDPAAKQVWVNNFLCECYEDETTEVEWETLSRRVEKYDLRKALPEGILCLTAFVDVQHNRLETELCGFGDGEECWHLEHKTFLGQPHDSIVWNELLGYLKREYDHPKGVKLGIELTLIDSGDGATQKDVFSFVSIAGIPVLASKGTDAGYAINVRLPTRREQAGTPAVVNVNVSQIKKALFQYWNSVKRAGPRYHHFCGEELGYTEEYFKQLTAEKCLTVWNRGYAKDEWHKVRERNEALDLTVGCVAACRYAVNGDWKHVKNRLDGMTQKKSEGPEKKSPEPSEHSDWF